MPIPDGFWPQISHQLARVEQNQPDTFDGVREILLDRAYGDIVVEVHRNGPRPFDTNSAFFAGSGSEDSLAGALRLAGWRTTAAEASYHYTMTHPKTGESLTYIEGDVLRGDHLSNH